MRITLRVLRLCLKKTLFSPYKSNLIVGLIKGKLFKNIEYMFKQEMVSVKTSKSLVSIILMSMNIFTIIKHKITTVSV